MKKKIIVIIQARMGSRRLFGKVMLKIKKTSILAIMNKRLKKSRLISKVYVATTNLPEDDIIQEEMRKIKGIHVSRGDSDNVLSRYINISKKENPDIIIRLTGDCPLVDFSIIDDLIKLMIKEQADYASNTMKRTFPDGLDVELLTQRALQGLVEVSLDKSSKEHVTKNILKVKINNKIIKTASLENDIDFSNLRWTLDESKDLESLKNIFKNLGFLASWKDIISFQINNPFSQIINNNFLINEGSKKIRRNKTYKKSNSLFNRASRIIPLASQTFSKSYMQWPKNVSPLFAEKAYDCFFEDIDGNRYIDYVLALLPIVLGYCDRDVDEAVIKQITKGNIYSLPSKLEVTLSEYIKDLYPSGEMVRYGKNGSDATSAAIRLARACTNKNIVLVAGYHGWHDWYIGSTSRNLGVPREVKNLTKIFKFNDEESLEYYFKKFPNSIACVILEPATLKPTDLNFLKTARSITKKYGALLIFDEIISGFRINLGGAQTEFNVVPDLTCLGKSMANGYPLSALLGKKKYMKFMEKIFFSSTFGGENIGLAASLATIKKIKKNNVVQINKNYGKKLISKINKKLKQNNLDHILDISLVDWWPSIDIKYEAINRKLLNSLLRQEFIKNGIFLSNTFNFCYAHSNYNILDTTVEKILESVSTVNNYLLSSSPKKYLKGELIQDTFKVRK